MSPGAMGDRSAHSDRGRDARVVGETRVQAGCRTREGKRDVALKAILGSIDEVSEAHRPLYREVTEGDAKGKFVLDVEPTGGLTLENTTGLRNTVSNLRAQVQAKDGELTDWKQKVGDIDLDAAKAALEKVKTGKAGPDVKDAVDNALRESAAKYDKIIGGKDAELAAITAAVNSLAVMAPAALAIKKLGGDVDLLLPHVQSAVEIERVDQEGKSPQFVPRIKAPTGGFRLSEKSQDPMTLEEFVSGDLKNRFPAAFPGSGSSGGGSTGGGTRNGSTPNAELLKLPPEARLAEIRRLGL